MSDIVLTGADSGVTAVPNGFIDRYLPEADGEFVKIYLLLWRYFCDKKSITILQLADLLDDTEKDVLRALRYWSRKGLLAVTLNERREVTAIRFLTVEGAGQPTPADETQTAALPKAAQEALRQTAAARTVPETAQAGGESSAADVSSLTGTLSAPERKNSAAAKRTAKPAGRPAASVPHAPSSAKRRELALDEDFGQLVYIVGKYLGEPLGPSGSDVLGYLYGELSMRADLLEYLVETCVDAGHKSLHYIEKVALDWHDKGIRTVEEAREQTEICRRQYYQVLKAFGLSRRGPAPEEQKAMDVWFYDYGFQLDIVLEACSRTIRAIHEPSFEYAGGILSDWKKKGVKSRSDIETLDQAFAREREAGKNRRQETAKPNRFHNFDQVGYDYDAIVKELNG